MRLELENRDPIENPTPEDISNEFANFDGWRASFAILSFEDERYIQTTGTPKHGFQIEYRDGGEGEHYVNVGGAVPFERVVAAFQQYAKGETSWWDEFEWEHISAHENAEPAETPTPADAGCSVVFLFALALGTLLAMLNHLLKA